MFQFLFGTRLFIYYLYIYVCIYVYTQTRARVIYIYPHVCVYVFSRTHNTQRPISELIIIIIIIINTIIVSVVFIHFRTTGHGAECVRRRRWLRRRFVGWEDFIIM